MNFWSTVLLVLKNWKYVVQFVTFINDKYEQGINQRELNEGLRKLDEAFEKKPEDVQDAADDARSINDSFRV